MQWNYFYFLIKICLELIEQFVFFIEVIKYNCKFFCLVFIIVASSRKSHSVWYQDDIECISNVNVWPVAVGVI